MSGPAPIETVIAAASPGTDRTARSIHVNFHVRVPAPHRGGTLNRAAGSLPPPILAAENDIRVDFRKKTNPNVIVEANYRSERAERFIDVRILLDLRHLLGVLHDPVCSSDLDGPGHDAGERTIGDLHAVVITEGGAEDRARHDVLDALRRAEAPVGEGKVRRYAQDLGVLQARGALIELTHAVRADPGVEGGEDVEHHPLAAEVLEADLAEFRIDESESGRLASDSGKLPHRVDRISIERNLCHKSFLPHSNVGWVTSLRVSLTLAAATGPELEDRARVRPCRRSETGGAVHSSTTSSSFRIMSPMMAPLSTTPRSAGGTSISPPRTCTNPADSSICRSAATRGAISSCH